MDFRILGPLEVIDRGRPVEAAPWLLLEGYTQPFAMRAVGEVWGDASLLERAAMTFEALGLGWHAARTRAVR